MYMCYLCNSNNTIKSIPFAIVYDKYLKTEY